MQSNLPPGLSFSGSSGIILANDVTVHDQNNKNNSSTDSILSSDENAFLETSNKKEGILLFSKMNLSIRWLFNLDECFAQM